MGDCSLGYNIDILYSDHDLTDDDILWFIRSSSYNSVELLENA
jgi:hypothetical protein